MSLVETPNLNDTVDKRLDTELFKYITNELNKKNRWNRNCSSALKESPSALFKFDRLQYMTDSVPDGVQGRS